MRLVILALALSFAACAQAPTNQAVYHAGTLAKTKPACIEVRTGAADSPDTALCEVGGKAVLWCWSGPGAGSSCAFLANFFPKEDPKPESRPDPNSTPKVEAKTEASKPEAPKTDGARAATPATKESPAAKTPAKK